jgi:crossover junction endodeoxyribonuclease RusA
MDRERMTDSISFTVYGTPVAQGSLRAFAVKGRAVVTQGGDAEARRKLGDWRTAIATEARAHQERNGGTALLDEPVSVRLYFTLSKPASVPKFRRWAWRKPDLDRLIRACLDAFTGTLIVDDARVVAISAEKQYGDPPRCEVVLEPLGAIERDDVHWEQMAR